MSGPYLIICPDCGHVTYSRAHSRIRDSLVYLISSPVITEDLFNEFCFRCGENHCFEYEV